MSTHGKDSDRKCKEARLRLAMGTWVAIEAHHEQRPALLPAIEAAFAAVLEVDWLMHPHRTGSDLARINQAPLPGERSTAAPGMRSFASDGKRVCLISDIESKPAMEEIDLNKRTARSWSLEPQSGGRSKFAMLQMKSASGE